MPAKISEPMMFAWHESAAHPADDRLGEIEDPVGDAGRVHQVAHQDEQRRREQRKRIDRHRHLLRNDDAGNAGEQQEGESGEPHRRVDRRPGEQRDEPDREDREHQRRSSRGRRRVGQRAHAAPRVGQRVQPHGERRERDDRVDDAHA